LILQNGTLSRSDGQVITRIRQKSASPHQKASKLNQGPTVKLNQSPTQSYITGSLASPPEKPKNNPWLIIYILCALGFVATLFVVFMYDAENPTPTPEINPTTASSSVEPTPPTAEERIIVTLQSVPPLAEVYQNDMFVGNTPYEVRLKEGEEMIVVIQLDGYSSKELRLTTQSPSPTVHLSKSPIKPSAPQTRPQEVNTPQEQPSEPSTEIQTRDPWEE
jgi:hypothetical protein